MLAAKVIGLVGVRGIALAFGVLAALGCNSDRPHQPPAAGSAGSAGERGAAGSIAAPAGAGGTPDPAKLPSEASFVELNQSELEGLCRSVCAKDPYPKDASCELFGGCDSTCLITTRGSSLPCAMCLVAAVSFTRTTCGPQDCVCGGASFPSLWSSCADACAATRQHERDSYAAEPRPLPVGRSPSLLSEAPEEVSIDDVAVDAADRVWLSGGVRTPGNMLRVYVAVHDADLKELWRWEDASMRLAAGSTYFVRLGGQMILSARAGGPTANALLFFDANGLVREVASGVAADGPPHAFGDDLFVKQESVSAGQPELIVLDARGAPRLRSPQTIFEGFNYFWKHAVHAGSAWTLVSYLDSGGVQWRRVAVQWAAAPPTASVAWTHRLEGELWRVHPRGAVAASGDDIVVWGGRSEQRNNVNGPFPWIALLGADGVGRWQWSNGQLVTPGEVRGALRMSSGQICALSEESWEKSSADPAQGGASCAPDGCSSITVRCFAPDGVEQWKYHHRSEHSSARTLAAADGGGALYVVGKIERDLLRSTGNRSVLMKFDSSP